MEHSHAILRVQDLWREYGESGAALRGVHLEVEARSVVALYGTSGSGKTTLLNLLAGLDRPTRGRVEVGGQDLEALGEKGRTLLRRRRLGFVFQFFNLLPTLTAFENVYLSLELAGTPNRSAAREALASLGLAGKERRYPHELSGGEQQRVAIARALVKKPALILADEPTGNLDTRTGDDVLDLLAGRCREVGATLLMATHSARVSRVADRILCMVDGVLEEGARCADTQEATTEGSSARGLRAGDPSASG
ncbi:MAG: ABC transporter ATP-binding protein [Deltaproteobacteria bacterium]|nr:ABC transporter ATP-binding protein [Deltaproteobacteria bacterium]